MFLLVTLSIAVVTLGLVAGYVLAFTNAVMPGLAGTDDRTFVAATQRIIAAVPNALFLTLSNLAAAALLAAIVAALVSAAGVIVLALTIGAFLLYAATLVLTFAVALPINNALVGRGDLTAPDELAQARTAFEGPWTRMNVHRTWTASVAVAAATAALVVAALQG